MKTKSIALFLLSFLLVTVQAQENSLEKYIQEALSSNISLQQKELSYQKSMAALCEAKANFLPVLSLEARYSVAQGGRAIELPIGDLMNPVYDNLNLINQRNQQSNPDDPSLPMYPQIENEEINFLRGTEHDTKLRVVFPIFNAAILQNQRIHQNLVEVEKMSAEAYRSELTKEVKVAYYRFQMTYEALKLYEDALELVLENLRTTQSLFRNHKITKDAVYGAETEVKAVEQQLAQARQDKIMAQAFFNFLLNRDHDTAIEIELLSEQLPLLPSLEEVQHKARYQRKELLQFNHFLSISDNQIALQKSGNKPTINLVGDYGFQGTNYSFSGEDDYAMGSVVLSWNIFNQSNKAKVQQARIAKLEMHSQKEEVQRQIDLQVIQAWYDMQTAFQQIVLSDKIIQSTKSSYQLVDKKYRQGQANLIELKDARTQQTNARHQKIIALNDLQVKHATLEWAMGQ